MRSDLFQLSKRLPRRRVAGFTVTELMVSISILAVIVIALYSVFNQTQRALRSNEAQVDITERGRAVLEMISRELEQSVATGARARVGTVTNMFGGIGYPPQNGGNQPWLPILQGDLNPNSGLGVRTNTLHELFFLNKQTNNWFAIGYKVVDATNGVGTLYRYSTNQIGGRPDTNLFHNFSSSGPNTNVPANLLNSSNYHRIADGVVHFRVTAYDPPGRQMRYDMAGVYTTNDISGYTNYLLTALNNSGGNRANSTVTPGNANVILQQAIGGSAVETRFAFLNNALPAYVDVELGVLEPETLKQYELIAQDGPASAAAKFLAKRINKVHLFRRRVPIPTTVQ